MPKRPPLSYTTTRLTLGTFLRIMFRPRYLDRDKIPVDGPLIIAANHLSHIDPAFIMTAMKRPVSYLSKKIIDILFNFHNLFVSKNEIGQVVVLKFFLNQYGIYLSAKNP